jgi:ubiquinone biosynthesis protein
VLRALIAGLLGFAAAEILVRTLQPVQSGHVAAFLTVVLGVPLVVAMDLHRGGGGAGAEREVPQPLDVVLGRAARAGALAALFADQPDRGAAWAGPYLRGRGRRAEDEAGGRAALARVAATGPEEGGVTFVKLGQLMSTRRDLLPEEFISELIPASGPGRAGAVGQVEAVITQSLGAPAGEVSRSCGRNRPRPHRSPRCTGPGCAAATARTPRWP